ncbi:Crossover junction endonuclease mus81 [Asimina triloba]
MAVTTTGKFGSISPESGAVGYNESPGSDSTVIHPRVIIHHLYNLKGSGSEAICPRVVIHHLHNLKGSGSEAIRPRVIIHRLYNLKGSGSEAICLRVVIHHLYNLKGSGSEAICPRVVIHHLHNLKGFSSEAIRPKVIIHHLYNLKGSDSKAIRPREHRIDKPFVRSQSGKVIENMCIQFKIEAEVRRLPVGDGIWIARHKHLDNEYVLDFIVERKEVDDLSSSIRDSRYRDQKLRLLRCGLQKLIYLVEGDPNSCEAAESIKTACFTTEILEGFDVHRTSGLNDTLRKYGYLTQAISHYYKTQFTNAMNQSNRMCPPFDEFIKKCQDLDKMTISDVFAIQLMQVPQVTEEIALAVLDMYPTVLSLAQAYALLDPSRLYLHRAIDWVIEVGAHTRFLRKNPSLSLSNELPWTPKKTHLLQQIPVLESTGPPAANS